jgi:histidinol-phosphate aminotransferase
MRIEEMVREGIRGLRGYEASSSFSGIKLDAMESPYDLPHSIKGRIIDEIRMLSFNRYPDPTASRLRKALSTYLDVDEDMTMVGNGSDELILMILLTFGDGRAIYPDPSFPMYRVLSKVAGKEGIGIPLREDFELDLPSILNVCKGGVVFIAYPNNPTGNLFAQDAIHTILADGSCMVVVDEAYYEFSKQTFLSFLTRYPNLIILRTFSKAFGLAGARVGYLIANREVVDLLNRVRLPYNLNAISQVVATITLRFRGELDGQIEEIIRERERVYSEMKGIDGLVPYRSETNFIFFKSEGIQAHEVFKALLKEGVLIRHIGDGLRVTIGREDENTAFLRTLRKVMGMG